MITPVIFRMDGDEVVAVFPTTPGNRLGTLMECYARMGQHASCGMGWYYTTRPATPAEYAGLKAELEGVPYEYQFKVCRRITDRLRQERYLA
jgi:hypothetical protein